MKDKELSQEKKAQGKEKQVGTFVVMEVFLPKQVLSVLRRCLPEVAGHPPTDGK